MPPWTTPWAGSADFFDRLRGRPRVLAVAVAAEYAGHTLPGPAVPWCADAIVLEVVTRPFPAARGRGDFALTLPGRPAVVPEAIRSDGDQLRLTFRLAALAEPAVARLSWRRRPVANVPLAVLTEARFRAGLRATSGVTVRLGSHAVAARSFVARQCRGFVAAASFHAPAGLVPLAHLGVTVELAPPTGPAVRVPVPIAIEAAAGTDLTLGVNLPAVRARGRTVVTWYVGGHGVRADAVRGVGWRRFLDGVRIVDSGFVVDTGAGPTGVRHPPARAGGRIGPRFVVANRAGTAGVVPFGVRPTPTPSLAEPVGRLLVTDRPTLIQREPTDLTGRDDVTGFELVAGGRGLGVVQLRPVPAAGFDAEGGFTPPPDFTWTAAADEELADRLGRLGEPNGG